MALWPETQATLIARLRSADDQETWNEFVRLYRPAIYRFARGQGLQDADAQDVTQKVLLSVAQAVESWEPDEKRGKFRAWLAQITRNAVINLATRDEKRRGSGRTSVAELLEVAAEPSDVGDLWRVEQQIQRYRAAVELVRPKCTRAVWDAFWFTAIEGRTIEETAAELDISVGAVYAARSRILKRLRAAVQRIERDESGEKEPT